MITIHECLERGSQFLDSSSWSRLQLEDDGAHARDILHILCSFGVEITQFGDSVPLCAGLDGFNLSYEVLVCVLHGCSVGSPQLLQLNSVLSIPVCQLLIIIN